MVCSDAFYGVERHVAALAREQARRGDTVTVVGGDPERMPPALGAGVEWRPGSGVAAAIAALRALKPRPDVTHAHMTLAEFAACVAGVRQDQIVVATRHFARRRGSTPAGAVASGLISRRLDGQLAISRYVAERADGRCVVVPPGVEAPSAAAGPRRPVALVVSRLEAEKRVDVALAGFAASGLAEAGWRLAIAGDGGLREELAAQAARAGLVGAVDFLGRRDDVGDLLASSSVLIAACEVEAFGLAVVEAMAAGLPVVAARSGGHLETLPEAALEHGFEPRDAAGVGAALVRLAADADLRERLARAGRALQLARFTPESHARATERFYLEITRRTLGGSWKTARAG